MNKSDFLKRCALNIAPIYQMFNWHWGNAEGRLRIPTEGVIFKCFSEMSETCKSGEGISRGGLFLQKDKDGEIEDAGFNPCLTYYYEDYK